jgi:hypothetical protein
MKKTILSLTVLLVATALAFPQNVIFKLSGGLSWLNGSDLNAGLAGETRAIQAASRTAVGGFEALGNGLGGQIEVMTMIGARLGVGFVGGYYRVSKISQISSHGLAADGTPFDATAGYNARVSVLPFGINVHYMMPIGSRLTLDAYAGPVFSIVQFNAANPTTSTISDLRQLITFTASQTALGGQIGLGLAFRVIPDLALIADGFYRIEKVGNLQGNWAQSGTADAAAIAGSSSIYYLWTYQSAGIQRIGFFDANGPTDTAATGARKAEIDLSGLALAAGIRFSF